MNATYRFTPDVRYYYQSRRRFERQRPFFSRQPVGSLLSVFPIVVVWFALWLAAPELEAAVRYLFLYGFAIYAVALIAIQGLLYWRIKVNASKVAELTFALSEEGISASHATAQSTIAWETWPRAVRFRDGMMLLRTRFHRVWLPDSALQGATPDEVTQLVQSKVRLQHVA
jgi:hypothetical protein